MRGRLLGDLFAAQDAAEWITRLSTAGVPCSPIHYVDEVFADPQVVARHAVVEIEHPLIGAVRSIATPLRYSGTPLSYRRHPPRLGEHTEEILRELRIIPADVESLRHAGVI